MITVDGLTVEFGGTTLFKDISFQINEKDRIALMGKNGAGKSTLLKIIAGVRTATRGTVSAPKDCVIAYLPQHLMTEDGRTVFDETCQAFAHLHEIQAEIDRINNELTTRTDYESDEYMQLIEKVSTLSEKFYAIDMSHFEEDVEKAVKDANIIYTDVWVSMGEPDDVWAKRIKDLSPYRVTRQVMDLAHDNAIFLHCLPSFHDLGTTVGQQIHDKYGLDEMEVTDEVFESRASRVFEEAENRMHTIKAVMAATLGA